MKYSKNDVLKRQKDMIYINAEFRRKVLDKWVYLTLGNEHTLNAIWDSMQIGVEEVFEDMEVYTNSDVRHWINKLAKK